MNDSVEEVLVTDAVFIPNEQIYLFIFKGLDFHLGSAAKWLRSNSDFIKCVVANSGHDLNAAGVLLVLEELNEVVESPDPVSVVHQNQVIT